MIKTVVFDFINHFIGEKINLKKPQSNNHFLIESRKYLNLSDTLGRAIVQIHEDWNNGTFTNFQRYIYLDENVFLSGPIPQKPNIFSNAEREFQDKLKDKDYLQVGVFETSPDNKILAYLRDKNPTS